MPSACFPVLHSPIPSSDTGWPELPPASSNYKYNEDITLEFSIVFFVKHISEVDFAFIKLQEHVLEGIWTTIHHINKWLIQHYYLVKKAVALIKSNGSIRAGTPVTAANINFSGCLCQLLWLFCCIKVLFKMFQMFTNKVCLHVLWVISAMGMMALLQWREY
jgi:hypothetical protein